MKKKRRRKPKPVVKWCQRCKKRRVRYHHYYCERCWQEVHNPTKDEIISFDNDNKSSFNGDKENGKIQESVSDEFE